MATGLLLAIVGAARAQDEPDRETTNAGSVPRVAWNEQDVAFFENRVRPLLVDHCYDCHSADVMESDLRVDSLAGLLQGGQRGPAIVPDHPEKSLLVLAINHADRLHMPPKTKLPREEIAAVTEWIRRGAPWPQAEPIQAESVGRHIEPPLTDEDLAFWAFQKPAAQPLPSVVGEHWVQSPIDRFVLARLEAAGLQPAPPADRRTLIRRATLDLLGVPPTPDEVAEFLDDAARDAFARLLDRLLASPRYGERWGRRWLDIARYGDSNGLDENLAFANAYRYRDYVIGAFNAATPYDAFLHEQLAGDLLPAEDANSDLQRIVATGYLAIGAKMLAEDDPVKMEMDIIDEQVDTLGRGLIGLTLGCARCHDHKFDPISAGDYYALAGIFKSTRTMENFGVVARWQERELATPEALAAQEQHRQRIDATQASIGKLVESANEVLVRHGHGQTAAYLLAADRQRRLDAMLRDAEPIGSRGDSHERADVRIVEAEAFDRGNVSRDVSGYGQGIGVLVNRGETPNYVEYDLEFAEAGLYQLELRYAAASARPCQLSINDRVVKADVAGQVTGSWYPDTQTWFVEGLFAFPAGRSTIRLEHPQFFPHLDKLLIAPAVDDQGVRIPLSTHATSDGELVDVFIRQWLDVLNASRDEPDSIFAPWHAWTRNGSLAEFTSNSPAIVRLLADPKPATLEQLAERYQQLAAAIAQDPEAIADPTLAPLGLVLRDAQGPLAIPPRPDAYYDTPVREELQRLRGEQQMLEKSLPMLPSAMAVSDGTPQELRIHLRGSHVSLGTEVPRRFPRILTIADLSPQDASGSGRLELAQWLTHPDHPLTARVMVNRLWQGHFGAGLVRSPDNFGRLGDPPTHPELLDWLANQLLQADWSIKALHRTIMLSATYQMSTAHDERAIELDPDNRLLWRMNRRRLEAEAIRDSILAAGGSLDTTMGASLLPTENRKYVTSTASVNPAIYESRRRSVYLPVVRSALYEFLQAFDFGDPSVMNARRDSTTVAPQALFAMNSKLMAEQAGAMADRILTSTDSADGDATRVAYAYEIAFSREPTGDDVARAVHYLTEYAETVRAGGESPEVARRKAWQSFCRALLAANEFIYVE